MTIETISRTNFVQNGVSELAAKHIEDCTSGPTSGDRKANASSRLTSSAVTITHVIHCLLLVQPMKRGNRPDITENLLTRT